MGEGALRVGDAGRDENASSLLTGVGETGREESGSRAARDWARGFST